MHRVRHLLPLLALLAGCPEPKSGGPSAPGGPPPAMGDVPPGGPGGPGVPSGPPNGEGQPVDLPPGVAPPPPTGVPMLVVDEAKATEIGGTVKWSGETGVIRIDILHFGGAQDGGVMHATSWPTAGEWRIPINNDQGTISLHAFIDFEGDGPSPTDPSVIVKGVEVTAKGRTDINFDLDEALKNVGKVPAVTPQPPPPPPEGTDGLPPPDAPAGEPTLEPTAPGEQPLPPVEEGTDEEGAPAKAKTKAKAKSKTKAKAKSG